MSKVRTYSELRTYDSFEDRFEYLVLGGEVGEATFGYDRWINQMFYTSQQWKRARRDVILRDRSCDLGIEGYDIHYGLLVHHLNPMTSNDIEAGEDWILNPEFLITTTQDTHNAIHYGNKDKIKKLYSPRQPGDTKIW